MARLILRDEWGAVAPRRTRKVWSRGGGVILHHSGGRTSNVDLVHSRCAGRMRAHQRYHMVTKGWNDIAYNFMVCPHGEWFEGRGWEARNGANFPVNPSTLSIMWEGTVGDPVDGRVVNTINQVLREARLRGWSEKLRGHKDVRLLPTSCPGSLYRLIKDGTLGWMSAGLPDSTRKSLFMQVRTYPESEIVPHLSHVVAEHRDRRKDDYVYNLVLNEIGTEDGLDSRLEAVAPFLGEFDNVFVGSHFIRDQRNPYTEGILDVELRWANLGVQRDLWRAFAERFPDLGFHFYVDFEGVLDVLDDVTLRLAYEAYLIQSVRDAHEIRPGAAVMWSPAVWSGIPLNDQELNQIQQMFSNVKTYTESRGVNWLHFQDMLGRGRPDVTKEDVAEWYYQLRALGLFDSLRVNMEMFAFEGGTVVPGDVEDLNERELWYKQQGIPVGASWEMRQWMPTHAEIE